MNTFKNYYQILQISFGADLPAIKSAYRKLAFQYHPDKNKASDAAQKFIAITEAYEVLRDDSKRANYDFLYKKYFQHSEATVYKEPTYQHQQQAWSDFGQQKAKEYSNMTYEDFSSRVLDEIKIGASYIPNLLTIAIVVFMAITMFTVIPKILSDSNGGMGFFVLLMIIGLGVLAYYLFKVMSADYTEERKRKFKN